MLLDLGLLFTWVWRMFYPTVEFWSYALRVIRFIIATVGLASSLVLTTSWLIRRSFHARVKRQKLPVEPLSVWQQLDGLDRKLSPFFDIPIVASTRNAALLVAAPVLLLLTVLTKQPYVPPASTFIADPQGRELYAVSGPDVILLDTQRPQADTADGHVIGVRTIPLGGTPRSIGLAPKRQRLYIVDSRRDLLVVVDQRLLAEVARIAVGKAPRSVAITADENLAFVSNEQTAPEGSISVVDLEANRVIDTIVGVNCPENLAVSPDATTLYVATQCGAGYDPLFIVDVRTHKVRTTPVIGSGTSGTVLASPDGERVYVSWGPKLSVINARNDRIVDSLIPGSAVLAITPDSRCLLVGTPLGIDIRDSHTLRLLRPVPTESPPLGIAVTRKQQVFALLRTRFYEFGLSGLCSV